MTLSRALLIFLQRDRHSVPRVAVNKLLQTLYVNWYVNRTHVFVGEHDLAVVVQLYLKREGTV